MKELQNILHSIDINTKKLMKKGIVFSFSMLTLSLLALFIFIFFYNSLSLYYIGFYLLKNSILFGCLFFTFGLVFDRIKKEIY